MSWPFNGNACSLLSVPVKSFVEVKLSLLMKNVLLFDRLLGQVEIPLHELHKNGKEIKKQDYELEDGKHRPTIVSFSLFDLLLGY